MNRTDILNHLAAKLSYKTYLEIGVRNPSDNFDRIICPIKVAVDPFPQRDDIVPLDSDAFFFEDAQQFDLIFIDGLHEREQVKRDIKNALSCLSPNGTIVVHDCNPSMEQSAQYPLDPNNGGEWCGSVYLGWIEMRQQLVGVEMYVVNCDYGCGIIYRDDKPKQSEVLRIPHNFNDFSASRATFLNLLTKYHFVSDTEKRISA